MISIILTITFLLFSYVSTYELLQWVQSLFAERSDAARQLPESAGHLAGGLLHGRLPLAYQAGYPEVHASAATHHSVSRRHILNVACNSRDTSIVAGMLPMLQVTTNGINLPETRMYHRPSV